MDFEDCITLYRNSNNAGGGCYQIENHEAKLLWNYAKQTKCVGKENTILEIGRYRAGSLVLLAMATHDSKVKIVSVDIVDGCRFCYTDAYDWLNDYEEKERIDIRTENSHAMENVPLSMLFVDGDHLYEGVKKDFIHHWNYLNGPCLAHDYDPTCEGVTKFIDEWIEEGYAEIIEQVGAMVALRKLKDYKI